MCVTVCIPTIPGREDLLQRAVRSVTDQSGPAEIKILTHLDVARKGAAHARNRLLSEVRTEWVAWLDDDDEFMGHHVSTLLEVLNSTGADLAYPIPEMASGDDPTAVSRNGEWVKPWGVPFGPEQEEHLRTQGSFIPITHLVRTSTVLDAGGFPEGRLLDDGRYQGEDERYLLSLLDVGAKFVHVPEKTWLWHGGHGCNTAGLADYDTEVEK